MKLELPESFPACQRCCSVEVWHCSGLQSAATAICSARASDLEQKFQFCCGIRNALL